MPGMIGPPTPNSKQVVRDAVGMHGRAIEPGFCKNTGSGEFTWAEGHSSPSATGDGRDEAATGATYGECEN